MYTTQLYFILHITPNHNVKDKTYKINAIFLPVPQKTGIFFAQPFGNSLYTNFIGSEPSTVSIIDGNYCVITLFSLW